LLATLLRSYLFIDLARDADPSGLWQTFQASNYVDAIAIDAAFILDHIAKIDAYPVVHLPIRSDLGVPVAHRVLNGNCTFDGIRDAVELGEDAVACSVNNAAAKLPDHRKRPGGL
jgi:hypothetical protein